MTALVANVTGDDVAMWLGRDDDISWITTRGAMFARVARQAASAYVRGRGFEDPDQVPAALQHVILMRAVRLAQNYSQVISDGADSVQTMYGAAGQGFTLQELKDLEEFRDMAA